MKKLLFLSNGIMLMLLLLSNTVNNKKTEAAPLNFNDVQLGVDPELARDMVKNFKSDIWNGRKVRNQVYLDSRSVWFSLYKLKKFIKLIEDSTSAANCRVDSFDLGIRIYFGDYPDKPQKWNYYQEYVKDHKLPDDYMGLHSVVMVPTRYNPGDGFHYDFDPRMIRSCNSIPMQEVMDSLIKIKKATLALHDPVSLFNRMACMIMPDNLDNKALAKKEFVFSGGGGPAVYANKNLPPNDPSFANAGTLIPPPYPADQAPAIIINPGNGGNTPQASVQKKYYPGKFHVPCSGASFMRWVDGTNVCGWNDIPIGYKTEKRANGNLKPE